MVNKFFYIKGGSETYYFSLRNLLKKHGHTVIDFSMLDEKNFQSPYSSYFIENVNYSETEIFKKIILAKKLIYSSEAKKKFEKLVIDTKPDVIHLHLFQHQISPSILDVIRKYNIPTVYTAHELKMICLNYQMMNKKGICEQCREGYWHCLQNRCIKGSLTKSLIGTLEGYFHKWRNSYDAIDVIITPSEFYREKFVQFGINPEKVIHLSNFLNYDKKAIVQGKKEYYLYFGRLSEEKGIITLLNAVNNLDIKLKIVGTGPLREEVESISSKLNNVKVLGFKSGKELEEIIAKSKAVIIPSEWYENGPYSAIEALSLGRPIIGANIGGIPEFISDNGFLFESGDANNLKSVITRLENIAQGDYRKMEEKSQAIFLEQYTAENHFHKLMKIYELACTNKKS